MAARFLDKLQIPLGPADAAPRDQAPGLDDDLKQQIADAFIDIANTEEGKALTEALFNVTEFARIDDPSVYDTVRDVSATFQRQ